MIAAERLALDREEHRDIVRLDGQLGRASRRYFWSHASARSPIGT